MYEIYDQQTGKRIGNLVKTTRAAEARITIIGRKTGQYPDYRKAPIVKAAPAKKLVHLRVPNKILPVCNPVFNMKARYTLASSIEDVTCERCLSINSRSPLVPVNKAEG